MGEFSIKFPLKLGSYDDRCNGYSIMSPGGRCVAVTLYCGGTSAAKEAANYIIEAANGWQSVKLLKDRIAELEKFK